MKQLLLAAVFAGVLFGQAQVRPLGLTNGKTGGELGMSTICNQSVVVAAPAGAALEVVALTSGQTVRVCGFSMSLSGAGTVKLVTGTGTNCGTGTADVTGAATLATGVPWTVSAGGGSVVAKGAASGALCVSPVTGNAAGVIWYAKF